MYLREESQLCSSEGEQPFICKQSRERRGWVGEKIRKIRDRSRISETISKKRENGEARDKKKGAQKKGKRERTQVGEEREKGRSKWVERQAAKARRPGCRLR